MKQSKPLFSVIVPVFNVEKYLAHALESILVSRTDCEVLLVNDCSTDRSLHIAEEYAAVDKRVRIINLPLNQGLGPARNAGLDEASGEYVVFLDSDDFFLPGALDALAEVALSSGSELVMFGYVKVPESGAYEPGESGEVSKAGATVVTTLAERPDLLNHFNVAWNKAYKKSMLERTGLRFPPGYYEDVPFSYPALALADSIALFQSPCIAYRQRSGSILRSPSTRHFELLDQIDRLFTTIDEHPELEAWREAIWRRVVSNAWFLLTGPGQVRVPRRDRKRFFRKVCSTLQGHRPVNTVSKKAVERLILVGSWNVLRLVKVALAVVRGISGFRTVPLAKRVWRTRLVQYLYYLLQRCLPIQSDVAVFSSLWGRTPSGNPLAIYRGLEEFAPEITPVWVQDSRLAKFGEKVSDVVTIGSARHIALMARAKYFVHDVNFPTWWRPRRHQVFLQTQHGTPLKTMWMDLEKFPDGGQPLNFRSLRLRIATWSFSLSSNRFSTDTYLQACPGTFETLEYGYPRNDSLVGVSESSAREAKTAHGFSANETVGLYMPTWREYDAQLSDPTPPAIMRQLSGLPVQWLLRWHHFERGAMNTASVLDVSGNLHNANDVDDPHSLYVASDFLVTDYSSAMFDYANLGKPIIIFAYDWGLYQRVRGTYFDITVDAPGVVVHSLDELCAVITSGEYNSEESQERLNRFREIFCEFDDGHATERVIRRFFRQEEVRTQRSGHPLPELRSLRR